jgi:hypothetical protein
MVHWMDLLFIINNTACQFGYLPLIMCTSQLNIATRVEWWSRNVVRAVIQFLNARNALVTEICDQPVEVYDDVMNQRSIANWCVGF